MPRMGRSDLTSTAASLPQKSQDALSLPESDSVSAGKRSVDYAATGWFKSLVNIVGPPSTETDDSTATSK